MLKATFKTLLALGCWSMLPLQAAPNYVAHVSMAVGEAQRVSSLGQVEPLVLGAGVSEQDRIITGKDAMVILIFSDQARVALRPDSELLIRHYKVDPLGVDTELQLDLLRGTVRQISGRAAQKQPERYRLNTPIAAIGVRGTDFLAKAGEGATEAYVHEGAIVVLPLVGVSSQSLLASASLSAGHGVQYSRTQPVSELTRNNVDPEDVEHFFGIRIAASKNSETGKMPGPVRTAQADGAVVANLFSVKEGDSAGRARLPSASAVEDGLTGVPSVVDPTPPVQITPLPVQLAWGRFSNAQALPWTLTLSFDEAKEGRHITVGELGQYALWRDGKNGSIDKSLRGQAEFTLAAGQAFYQQAEKTVLLSLANPSLQVNFDRSIFATSLTLSGDGAPGQLLNVGGRINGEGMFIGTAPGQRVAGALSSNGAEAGYLFKIDGGAGQYQGITLWNAK